MNCKKGDLAIMVESKANNEGRIFTCLEFVGMGRSSGGNLLGPKDAPCTDLWRIDVVLPTTLGNTCSLVRDAYIRPLRDSDGQDETLTWVPKKEKVRA